MVDDMLLLNGAVRSCDQNVMYEPIARDYLEFFKISHLLKIKLNDFGGKTKCIGRYLQLWVDYGLVNM